MSFYMNTASRLFTSNIILPNICEKVPRQGWQKGKNEKQTRKKFMKNYTFFGVFVKENDVMNFRENFSLFRPAILGILGIFFSSKSI